MIICLVVLVVAGVMLVVAVAVEHERTGKPPREILAEAFQRLLP